MVVYEVTGWFADHEWSEGLFAREEDAEALCRELWKERKPRRKDLADYLYEYSVCKFAVEDREVIGG